MSAVIAKLEAREAREARLKQAQPKMVEAVSANEPGVSVYSLHMADDGPTLFLLCEQYESTAAQNEHGGTRRMEALRGKEQHLLGGRPEIAHHTQITGIER